jgi:hypothetical protein
MGTYGTTVLDRCARYVLAAVLICALIPATAWGTVTLGQIDDFEDGTMQNWVEGGPSPNPPFNIADGGPGGAGDNYLSLTASGGSGPGSRQIMFNRVQWRGNFISAGVDTVSAMMANFGAAPVTMRVAIEGDFGQRYASTIGQVLPADGVWYPVSFDLTASGMTQVGGTHVLPIVLSNVNEFRILASAAPSYLGDAIVSSVGVDDIAAVPEPASLGLLALGAVWGLRRRS